MFKVISISDVIKSLDSYNFTELHIHHTWKPEHKDFTGSNHIKLQESMRNYHVNHNKWDDIAQHLTLAPDGKFVTGRSFNSQPASIKGKNGGSKNFPLMVEMIGNFDQGRDELKGDQLHSILVVARYFIDKGKYVRFHRENSNKTCPGSGIDKDRFIRQAKELYKMEKKKSYFSDVEKSWAKNQINEVHEAGLLNEYPDGTFKPGQLVTREELAVVLSRLLKK